MQIPNISDVTPCVVKVDASPINNCETIEFRISLKVKFLYFDFIRIPAE